MDTGANDYMLRFSHNYSFVLQVVWASPHLLTKYTFLQICHSIRANKLKILIMNSSNLYQVVG